MIYDKKIGNKKTHDNVTLKVHKNEIYFGSFFESYTISLLVMP